MATFTVRRVPGAYGRRVSGLGGGSGATATAAAAPAFGAAKLTTAPWREQGLARIAEQRFVLACIQDDPTARHAPNVSRVRVLAGAPRRPLRCPLWQQMK